MLIGTLTNYGISAAQPFSVVVTDCVATVSISSVSLPTLQNTWYSAANTYDISGIAADIVQTPNC